MQPITRKEMYLAKISGDYSGAVLEPVTRMDYYMACAAGAYERVLPRPIRQQEFYWAYICGATDIELPAPITRVDIYLAAICGGNVSLPKPITREEMYLYKIAEGKSSIVKAAAGKTIALSDSLSAPFEDFRVYGRTTQETTTGAQLFDGKNAVLNANKYNCTAEYEDGKITLYATGEDCFLGGFINSGDSAQNPLKHILIPVETGKKYYIKTKSGVISRIVGNYLDENYANIANFFDVESINGLNVPENAKYLNIRIGVLDSIDGGAYSDYIMVNEGSTALPWEPYTGGIPSPNPDYPQELVL